MSTEIHFNKAWQRRIHERAMALEGKRETEYQRKERIADQERERRARTRGDFFKPMNWTPEERVRLNAWRKEVRYMEIGIHRGRNIRTHQ